MYLAICWSGSFNLHLWRQKSNCSSHIFTQFIYVHFGVIFTSTLLENLLSVIVTHSNDLLTNVPRYTSSSLAFAIDATDHIKGVFANLHTAWWAELPLPPTVLLLLLSIVVHISGLHCWISGRVCYMYRKNHRQNYLWICRGETNYFVSHLYW